MARAAESEPTCLDMRFVVRTTIYKKEPGRGSESLLYTIILDQLLHSESYDE